MSKSGGASFLGHSIYGHSKTVFLGRVLRSRFGVTFEVAFDSRVSRSRFKVEYQGLVLAALRKRILRAHLKIEIFIDFLTCCPNHLP